MWVFLKSSARVLESGLMRCLQEELAGILSDELLQEMSVMCPTSLDQVHNLESVQELCVVRVDALGVTKLGLTSSYRSKDERKFAEGALRELLAVLKSQASDKAAAPK